MTQKFKHKETGEIITVPRVQYFLEPEYRAVDPSGTYDLTQYDYFDDENETATYSSIKTIKSNTDGRGVR